MIVPVTGSPFRLEDDPDLEIIGIRMSAWHNTGPVEISVDIGKFGGGGIFSAKDQVVDLDSVSVGEQSIVDGQTLAQRAVQNTYRIVFDHAFRIDLFDDCERNRLFPEENWNEFERLHPLLPGCVHSQSSKYLEHSKNNFPALNDIDILNHVHISSFVDGAISVVTYDMPKVILASRLEGE